MKNIEMREKMLKIIGESCRRWRAYMDISMAEMAALSGKSISGVSTFESGKGFSLPIYLSFLAAGFDMQKDLLDPRDMKTRTSIAVVMERLRMESENHDA